MPSLPGVGSSVVVVDPNPGSAVDVVGPSDILRQVHWSVLLLSILLAIVAHLSKWWLLLELLLRKWVDLPFHLENCECDL